MIWGGTLNEGYAEKGPVGPATGVSWWQTARSLFSMYLRWPSSRGPKSRPLAPVARASARACSQSWAWTSMSPVTRTVVQRMAAQAGPFPGVGVGVGVGVASGVDPGVPEAVVP